MKPPSSRYSSATRRAAIIAAAMVTFAGAVSAEPEPRAAHRIASSAEGLFGYRVVVLDSTNVNGDARDLAISDPFRSVAGGEQRGVVTLYRHNGAGWVVVQEILSPTGGSAFGAALAVADLDNDNRDDLVIGAPDEASGTGNVYLWRHPQNGAPILEPMPANLAAIGGHCGFSLAIGDFNSDGDEDVAVGCPDATVAAINGAGSVLVGYGDGTGDFITNVISQNTAGIGGGAESGDRFGYSLASGRFDTGLLSSMDLAIGVPFENVDGAERSGALHILLGDSATGLSGTGSQLIHQGTTGVPGISQDDDRFALTLATGPRISSFSFQDYLAVGIPDDFENPSGSVLVFDSGSNGLRTDNVQQINALDFPPDPSGRAPNPSTSQPVRFGSSLAVGNIGRDGEPELLIGVQGYAATFPFPAVEPGLLCVAFGMDGTSDTDVLGGGQRCYGDDQFDAPAAVAPNFGAAVAVGRLDGAPGAELVIASPYTREVFVLRNILFGDGFESN